MRIPILNYENLYEIDNDTFEVWNKIKNKKLKVGTAGKNYKSVVLRKNKKSNTLYIHRLIAMHFIPNPFNKPQVNHIDGNKLNNNMENLEWATCRENIIHAWETGLSKTHGNGSEDRKGKVVHTWYNKHCKVNGIVYRSILEASQKSGVAKSIISKHLKGTYLSKKHKIEVVNI